MIPELFSSPEKCCACGACLNICPKDAISFQSDKYGFQFPVIDETQCIGCGKCVSVCDFHNEETELRRTPIRGYAAVLHDRVRLKQSASGGVFWAVAEWIIKKGGCVFGCVWDSEMNPVHVCAESIEQLVPMQGSKYVQSDIGLAYRQVKKKLEEDRYVLFTGTPCQVAGLRSFLKNKSFERLFTIDLVCHGVPNNAFFHQYIGFLEKQYDAKVIDFHFRHKRPDWLNGCIWVKFKKKNKTFTRELFHKESLYYMRFTPNNQCCRLSCAGCKYACSRRVGDMTMGDFWGFNKAGITLKYNKGLSCVLVNDARVLSIINELDLELQEVSIDSIVNGNGQLRHPYYKDEMWDQVMEASANGEFERLINEYNEEKASFIRRARIKKLLPPRTLIFLQKIVTKVVR